MKGKALYPTAHNCKSYKREWWGMKDLYYFGIRKGQARGDGGACSEGKGSVSSEWSRRAWCVVKGRAGCVVNVRVKQGV